MAQTSPPFWLGGAAASMAACFTHPLDLTKVRMQTARSQVSGVPKSATMLKTLAEAISRNGVMSLYTGLSASILRQMSYSLVRIGSYEAIKARLTKDTDPSKSPGRLILSGAIAGGLGGVAGNPADILLVRMTTDALRPPSVQHRYRNAIDGLVRLIKEEGPRALGRGIGANTVRAIIMNASQLSSYDYFKSLFKSTAFNFKEGVLLHVLSSCASGVVATTACAPADVLKSRVMASSNSSSSVMTILRTSLRNEGVRFLFKGWTPAFVRLAPNTILMFVFLEQLKTIWNNMATK